jgi:hypothetical protein
MSFVPGLGAPGAISEKLCAYKPPDKPSARS